MPGPTDPHDERAGEGAESEDRGSATEDPGVARPSDDTPSHQATVAPEPAEDDHEAVAAREMERIMTADPSASGLRPAPRVVTMMIDAPDEADTKPDLVPSGPPPPRDVIPLPLRPNPMPRAAMFEVPGLAERDDVFDADAVTRPDSIIAPPPAARIDDGSRPAERESAPHKATRPRPIPRAERPIEAERPTAERRPGSRWGGPIVLVLIVGAIGGAAWAWNRSSDPQPTSARAAAPSSRVANRTTPPRSVEPRPLEVAEPAQPSPPTPPSEPTPKPTAPVREPVQEPIEEPTEGPVEPVEAPIEAPATPPDAPGDPRTIPAGTGPDAAAAFAKLPVSPADHPPVGGVGATGIHVDRISMGATYEEGDCAGAHDGFSVAAKQHPSVCVRVVHPREKEEVAVLWQKKGGSTRRGKMFIKPVHAYRTRAYLVLRSEYVGDWTVKIVSDDGVELATHDFRVVE